MVILHYFLRLTTNMVQYIMEYFVQLPLRHLHHSPPQSWCHTLTMQTADLSDGAPRNHNMLSPLLTNQMKPLVGVNLLLFVRVWAEGSPRRAVLQWNAAPLHHLFLLCRFLMNANRCKYMHSCHRRQRRRRRISQLMGSLPSLMRFLMFTALKEIRTDSVEIRFTFFSRVWVWFVSCEPSTFLII